MVELPADEKLKRVASKAAEWYGLDAEKKLGYLEYALETLKNSEALCQKVSDVYQDELRKVNGEEREFYNAFDSVIFIAMSKNVIAAYLEAFRMKAGTSKHNKILSNLETRTTPDGQVVAKVNPLLPEQKSGTDAKTIGEVTFLSDKVTTVEDVKPWEFDSLQEKEPGLCVVLGAGNYASLTVFDFLNQMFQKNQVVFIKQHEIRGAVEEIFRVLFKPLYDDGYLDSELHVSMERSSEILYSPHVTGVHITGGKAAHDKIVWGATAEEQQRRRRAKDPKLKARMTSELGAVTPYMITPARYAAKELDHQAQVLVSAKWMNGGASCNGPQVVVMSDQWEQKDEFVGLVRKYWTETYSPVVYYPGTQDRVDGFAYRYKDKSTKWMGRMPEGAKSNHMPLLVIDVEVDLSTETGRKAAKEEYAFQNEAFGPVLIFATLKSSGDEPSSFLNTAVTLANDYMFGTLSCSLMAPDQMVEEIGKGDARVEEAIQKLQYGSVAINAWSAVCYNAYGSWGGYHVGGVETLENVQSGVGDIGNALFLPNIEKQVVRKPLIDDMGNMMLTKPRKNMTRLFQALPRFLLRPGILSFWGVLEAMVGPAVYAVPATLAGLAAVVIRLTLLRS